VSSTFNRRGAARPDPHYTREAGVRTLERELANLARKAVRQILKKGKAEKIEITPGQSRRLPRRPKFRHGSARSEDQIGAVTGLAWTEVGGELLTIEAVTVPGKGQIKTTGKLGDVMKESIQAAFLRPGAGAELSASSRRLFAARPTSTSTCPRARCRRTAPRPASAWSPRSSRP
jgi:ATP-dependent Lon protease